MRRHWLKTTTLRPWVDDEARHQLAQLEQLGRIERLDQPLPSAGGPRMRRPGRVELEQREPVAIIRCVARSDIRRRNSGCVSGRRSAIGRQLGDRLR